MRISGGIKTMELDPGWAVVIAAIITAIPAIRWRWKRKRPE